LRVYAAGLAFLVGAAFLAAAFLGAGDAAFAVFEATGAAPACEAVFKAARLSRQAVISSTSLFLRSVNLAITALIFAMALSPGEGAAFFGAALAAGLAALAGGFAEGVADLGAAFFAVAMMFYFLCY
jgi:hypothetical protein